MVIFSQVCRLGFQYREFDSVCVNPALRDLFFDCPMWPTDASVEPSFVLSATTNPVHKDLFALNTERSGGRVNQVAIIIEQVINSMEQCVDGIIYLALQATAGPS